MKSQWEFGELFPSAATRKVWSVAELTTTVKRLLEKSLGLVWVTGEISNFRAQSSGHFYFTLKDAAAQLSCVLFRGESAAQRGLLQDGQKVVLQGDLTVYEPRGQYQLVVRQVELQGLGALQLAFERLKQKLNAEGLFAPERKRPLARFPRCIGLVTSPTGAAIRDVIHVIERRHPALEIIFAPCRVQGQGAAAEIAAAIQRLNEWAFNAATRSFLPEGQTASPELFAVSATRPQQRWPIPELILVTRGGGSLEDLWAFNEEIVARAIGASRLPVVSAVGHEIDFTISDFVADLRAATPSAAAEIITEGVFASRAFVAEARQRMGQLARRCWDREQERLEQMTQRLARVHPRRRLNEHWQRLDDLQSSLWRGASLRLRELQTRWLNAGRRFLRARPSDTLDRCRERWRLAGQRLRELTRGQWERQHNRLQNNQARLRLLSPQNVLDRGYSITMDASSGQVIRAATEAIHGQKLKTRLQHGQISSIVEGGAAGMET